jgi:hypothetical protein
MNTNTNTKLSNEPQNSRHELSEQALDSVTGGGRLGPGPMPIGPGFLPLNPQPLPPG